MVGCVRGRERDENHVRGGAKRKFQEGKLLTEKKRTILRKGEVRAGHWGRHRKC